MNVIQFFGGPGVGKSTVAAYLYYRFKKAGFRTELVGEAAREIIYNSDPSVTAPQLIDNQLLLAGMQYERLLRLKRHGIEVAISDSPLIQGVLYAPQEQQHELHALLGSFARGFNHTNVLIERELGHYDKESRAQTEAEAVLLDVKTKELLFGIDSPINMKWGEERQLADTLIDLQKIDRARCALEVSQLRERYRGSWRG